MRPFRVLFCRPGIQNNLLFLNAKPNLNSTKNRLCTSDGFGCGKIVRFRQCLNSSLNCVTALVATCCLRPVFDWCQHGYNPQQFGSDSADVNPDQSGNLDSNIRSILVVGHLGKGLYSVWVQSSIVCMSEVSMCSIWAAWRCLSHEAFKSARKLSVSSETSVYLSSSLLSITS